MEYGLLTGLIALAIVSALSMFSTDVNQLFVSFRYDLAGCRRVRAGQRVGTGFSPR